MTRRLDTAPAGLVIIRRQGDVEESAPRRRTRKNDAKQWRPVAVLASGVIDPTTESVKLDPAI